MGARRTTAFAFALAVFGAACAEDLPPGYGTARIAWTIDHRAERPLCAEYRAALVHVVILGEDQTIDGDDWAPCDELEVSYVLRRGGHRARLTLAGANHAFVSPTRESVEFYVDEAREVAVVVDLTPDVLVPAAARNAR
jgi:hypothetical protein